MKNSPAPKAQETLQAEGRKNLRARGPGSFLSLLVMLETMQINPTGLQKHELRKNGTSGHAKEDRKKIMRLQPCT